MVPNNTVLGVCLSRDLRGMQTDTDQPPTSQRTSASVQAPFIYLLKSCNSSAAPMRLGCLVKDYFPKPVTVTWTPNFENMSTLVFPATSLNSTAWVTTSQVTAWGKPANNFTCRVAHVPSATYKNLAVPHPNITQPTVKLLHSSCDPNGFDSTIQLYCFIYDHTPGDVFVTWFKNGQEIPTAFPSDFLLKQEGKLATTYSGINISREEWVSESTFTCQVASQGMIYMAHARKCQDNEPHGVNIYLIPPSPLDLYVNKTPKLTCLVVDLESENLVTVEWTRKSKKPVGQVTWYSTRHYNATTSITSILAIDAKDWTESEVYKCTVSHPDLPRPIERSICKAQGQHLKPKVYVFLPPEEEIQENKNKKLTLTCLVQNFFPEDISVQWLRGGELIPINQFNTTAPLTIGSQTAFFIFSCLQVTQTDWVQNNKFTCRVTHEALPYPRTLEKTVSKNLGLPETSKGSTPSHCRLESRVAGWLVAPELDLQDLCAEEAESEELEELQTSTYIFIALFLLSLSYGATVSLLKVKWIFSALMQAPPQTFHDYTNILQPRV